VLPPFRRRAAGQGYEKSLLFAVQFGLRAGSGALLQGSFQPLFSKSLADVPHGLGGYLEHIGNEAVGVPCGREEQDAGPSEHPGFGRSLLEETQQVRLLLIRQDHYIGLGPRHLPSLHIGFCGGKDTQRNQCGQVLGHTIQFDGVNSGCSYDGGLAAGQTLAADASIVAVIGTSCSSAARAAVPLLSAAGFVIVSPSNTAPSLTEPGNPDNHPGYLRTAPNDKIQGAMAAEFAYRQLGVTKAATIRDGSLYADYLRQAFANEFTSLGGTITAQEVITPQQTDMSAVLSSIATGSPGLLYFPVFMPAGGYIINQARTTAGLESAYLMGADGLFTPAVVTATGANVEGFMVTSPDFTQNSAEYYDSFLPAYRAKFGDPTAPFHAHAYDAFMMIKAAIERVAVVYADGTIQIGRQALRDAMYSTRNFPGLTGNLTCSATGDCADPHIAVYRYHAGQFPPEHIWPQTRGIISPESGGMVTSEHGDTTVQIPSGAITDTIVITYTLAHSPAPGGNLIGIGHVFDVTAVYSGTGQPAQIAPGHTYTVTVQYTDAEKGPAIESTLALYYWDGSQWIKEPSSVVDTANNTVTAMPNHFSRWAVLGETRRVYLPLILKNY
jgi:branched-chain amino acid transport system substrate-binding protein